MFVDFQGYCFVQLKIEYNNWSNLPFVDSRVAVKAMQKKKITDYESFQNEINILMNLVSLEPFWFAKQTG